MAYTTDVYNLFTILVANLFSCTC